MKNVLTTIITITAVMCINYTSQAVPTVPVGQSIYNTTIVLSHPDYGDPNFYTNFKTTEANGLAELWAVAGTSNDADKAYVNWQYGAGNLELGDENYQHGTIMYHFYTNDLFNGGKVTNSANYQGGYEHIYVATTAVAPTTANNWNGFSITPYEQKYYDQYWSEGVYEVNIPVGVKEFWVVISKPGKDFPPLAANSWQRYLRVTPNITKVAGPNEAPLILWGSTDPRLLTYEWQKSVENELGISGIYLGDGGSFIIGDPNSTIFDNQSVISAAATAGKVLGMDTFALMTYFGLTNDSWSGQTWAAGAEWTNAIRSVEDIAQFATNVGANVIIIDMENYGSISNYLINQSGGSVTTDAYNRGAEFAAAVRSKAPRTTLMLIPEYGIYPGSGSYPAVRAFRNGLMSVTPHLNVLVGLEYTYGWGPDPAGNNDNKIMSPYGVEYTDPNAYKTTVINYMNAAKTQLRAETYDPNIWDQYGGVAPGFYMLGTWSDHVGKRSAWYTPKLFAAQLEAFQQAGAKLIWEFSWRFPWVKWELNETIAAGLQDWQTLDPSNPEYWTGWYSTRDTHPYIGAYIEVIKARGTPDPNAWVSQMAGDINKDFYVNFIDLDSMALQWLDSSPTNVP
jgi:hypothetical protein